VFLEGSGKYSVCEYDEEPVILFKKARLFLVMVTVEIPEESMHNEPVCEPGNAFHDQEGQEKDQNK